MLGDRPRYDLSPKTGVAEIRNLARTRIRAKVRYVHSYNSLLAQLSRWPTDLLRVLVCGAILLLVGCKSAAVIRDGHCRTLRLK